MKFESQLNDLLDDLTQDELTSLVGHLWVNKDASRAAIIAWRKKNEVDGRRPVTLTVQLMVNFKNDDLLLHRVGMLIEDNIWGAKVTKVSTEPDKGKDPIELENIKLAQSLRTLLEYVPIQGHGVNPVVPDENSPRNKFVVAAKEILSKHDERVRA